MLEKSFSVALIPGTVQEIPQAYQHSWDGQHYFYYHQRCVEQNPPDAEVTFEPIPLDDVPSYAECDFCYRLVSGSNGPQNQTEQI